MATEGENEMLYLNDGFNREVNMTIGRRANAYPYIQIPAKVNCALCAAVLMHCTGKFTTSGCLYEVMLRRNGKVGIDLLKNRREILGAQHQQSLCGIFYNLGKNYFSKIDDVNNLNIKMMTAIVKNKRGNCNCGVIGSTIKGGESDWENCGVKLYQVGDKIKKLGDKNIYAVMADGHWNLVHFNELSKLEYVDYQSDHVDYSGPSYGAEMQFGMDGERTISKDVDAHIVVFETEDNLKNKANYAVKKKTTRLWITGKCYKVIVKGSRIAGLHRKNEVK